jgi:hypothetical protein
MAKSSLVNFVALMHDGDNTARDLRIVDRLETQSLDAVE